jgi:hypothetical protein
VITSKMTPKCASLLPPRKLYISGCGCLRFPRRLPSDLRNSTGTSNALNNPLPSPVLDMEYTTFVYNPPNDEPGCGLQRNVSWMSDTEDDEPTPRVGSIATPRIGSSSINTSDWCRTPTIPTRRVVVTKDTPGPVHKRGKDRLRHIFQLNLRGGINTNVSKHSDDSEPSSECPGDLPKLEFDAETHNAILRKVRKVRAECRKIKLERLERLEELGVDDDEPLTRELLGAPFERTVSLMPGILNVSIHARFFDDGFEETLRRSVAVA